MTLKFLKSEIVKDEKNKVVYYYTVDDVPHTITLSTNISPDAIITCIRLEHDIPYDDVKEKLAIIVFVHLNIHKLIDIWMEENGDKESAFDYLKENYYIIGDTPEQKNEMLAQYKLLLDNYQK